MVTQAREFVETQDFASLKVSFYGCSEGLVFSRIMQYQFRQPGEQLTTTAQK